MNRIKRDKHIDLMPIFQKKFNTSIVKEASFDDLSAAQCKEPVQMCSIRPFSTKAKNVKMLGAVDYNHVGIVENYMKANTEVKIVKKFGLKHCYYMIFGGEVGMTGEDVPEVAGRHPLKQGLKPHRSSHEPSIRFLVAGRHPLKQGLKPEHRAWISPVQLRGRALPKGIKNRRIT